MDLKDEDKVVNFMFQTCGTKQYRSVVEKASSLQAFFNEAMID